MDASSVREGLDGIASKVGELVLSGMWYSDACEVVWIVLELSNSYSDEFWEDFEVRVNTYTQNQKIEQGREVPEPGYKNIF